MGIRDINLNFKMKNSKVRKIGLLTSGGDSSGMNAAIRAVVRYAIYNKLNVIGVNRGYDGLIEGDFVTLEKRSVSNIISRGGTILKTARSREFLTRAGQKRAVDNLKAEGIDCLIVIGGGGSLRGAEALNRVWKVPTIGIPASIDNDIYGTDYSIGADTAVNVALEAIDKIRDTVTSLERIFIIEVMGRSCGYIAQRVALASGAENVIIPESRFDLNLIAKEIKQGYEDGKASWLIIVAEGAAKAQYVADIIKRKTRLETRVTVLGHIQRGGNPTAFDRITAAKLGVAAVESAIKGKSGFAVGIFSGKIKITGLRTACRRRKKIDRGIFRLVRILK